MSAKGGGNAGWRNEARWMKMQEPWAASNPNAGYFSERKGSTKGWTESRPRGKRTQKKLRKPGFKRSQHGRGGDRDLDKPRKSKQHV